MARKVEGIQTGIQSLRLDSGATVGSNLQKNRWQSPICEFGANDSEWEEQLKKSPLFGNIDIGRKEWARSKEAVDKVMSLIREEMCVLAEQYEGLTIGTYVRQGSARDGLKVVAPDEFDTVLEFSIEGVTDDLRQRQILDNEGQKVPGFCYLEVPLDVDEITEQFPTLFSANIFQEYEDNETVFLSSKRLYQKVLLSLIDKACVKVTSNISSSVSSPSTEQFKITRKINPPAINITIHLDDAVYQHFMSQGQVKNSPNLVQKIDLDIVPAIKLREDQTTTYQGTTMNCPIHAVCKWAEHNSVKAVEFIDQDIVWDVKTAGYEKHIIDFAREVNDMRMLYILTALRIMKTYFIRSKLAGEASTADEDVNPPFVVTILKSYHLKQISFYLIYFLCHKYTTVKVDGVQTALLYFMDGLHAVLGEERLPHFFLSSRFVSHMFHGFPMKMGKRDDVLKYDLLMHVSSETLEKACESLTDIWRDLGFPQKSRRRDRNRNSVYQSFCGSITNGEYL